MLDILQFFLFSILLLVKEGQLGVPGEDVCENQIYSLNEKKPVSFYLAWKFSETSQSGPYSLGWHQGREASSSPRITELGKT